jgi:class 3 adenylate cyclase
MNGVFESTEAIRATLERGSLDARELHEIWDLREPIARPTAGPSGTVATVDAGAPRLPWLEDSSLAVEFVRRALEAGEHLLACDAAQEGLRRHRGSIALRQALARGLAGLGSSVEALRILDDIGAAGGLPADVEAHNLLLTGALHLESAQAAAEPQARAGDLRLALTTLCRASERCPGDPAPVVEAATAALLLGGDHSREALELAERAIGLAGDASSAHSEDDPDLVAARARAHAILGEIDAAREDWRRLRSLPGVSHQALAEARHQARQLAAAHEWFEGSFDDCFPPLRLVVFSGHMIDEPGRRPARFPPALEGQVRDLVRAALAAPDVDARVGFSSAAAGSDLIFLEEMLARGADVHVVLPWPRDAFLATSVGPFGDAWVERFHAALERATSVRVLGELHGPSDAVGFEYANAVLAGLATLRARALRHALLPMVVWDGQPGLPGGTGTFVEYWRSRLVPVHEIPIGGAAARLDSMGEPPPAGTQARRQPAGTEDASSSASGRPALRQEVRAMLFADIVGYSKLPERFVPAFVREFLGRVSRIVAESPNAPISVNTWGDAVYFVFERAELAGLFALELTEMIENAPWERLGLVWHDTADGRSVSRPLGLRTGLHAGPVFVHFDPIVRRLGFTGAHVSRAARIEPVTEPGQVFASEEFAALAAAEGAQGFVCDFVGTMPLAKKYPGEFRIHRLRRPRQLPVDLLARVIHEDYCRKAVDRGETAATNRSLRSWEDLPAEFRDSNRSQAADIRVKLRELLGFDFETVPGRGDASLEMSPAQEELLARAEHERWCAEKRAGGWTHGSARDDERRVHPSLVAWENLSRAERDKDFDAVRNIPRLLALAGFRVRRIGGGGAAG